MVCSKNMPSIFFKQAKKKNLYIQLKHIKKSYKNINKLDASRIMKPTTLDKNPSKWSNVNYDARRRPLYFKWLMDHLTTWVIRTRVVHITNVSTPFYSLHYAWDELGARSRRTWRLPAARRPSGFWSSFPWNELLWKDCLNVYAGLD